jgi:hypothetical protein
MPPLTEFIFWSVAASTHCLMTCCGMPPLSNVMVNCHSPALRAGMSSAGAGDAKAAAITKAMNARM